jgi:hypothetical protein
MIETFDDMAHFLWSSLEACTNNTQSTTLICINNFFFFFLRIGLGEERGLGFKV